MSQMRQLSPKRSSTQEFLEPVDHGDAALLTVPEYG
jgi:hypothetical protein